MNNSDKSNVKEINSKLVEINKTLFKSFFAHHPNCDQYDHHVITIGDWRFCLGCTGMYFGLFTIGLIDLFILNSTSISYILRFFLGLGFFIPAVIQLRWKSRKKPIKFLMRYSLGLSIWGLLSAIYYTPYLLLQILALILFIISVRMYSYQQGAKSLIECQSCEYDQEYHSCLIKHEGLLRIDNLELVRDEHDVIRKVLDLRDRMDQNDAVKLPQSNDIGK